MINLLITLVIFLVIYYIAKEVVATLGLPANIARLVYLILGVIALLWLLNVLGLFSFPSNTLS